jgi:hypothetical protein
MNHKICHSCGETKELNKDNFPLRKNKNGVGYRAQCRLCYNALRRKNPRYARKKSIQLAKDRAKKRGLDFNLSLDEVVFPDVCPILNIKLEHGNQDWQTSPSIDRIDNSKGYTLDNIIVVSALANSIKNCATWKQIIQVGKFYKNLEKEKNHAKI